MTMPTNLIFVRHGLSEANIMQAAAKKGDNSLHTEERVTVPDRSWRLAYKGREQAATAGSYIKELGLTFQRHLVSPYTRTRETAGLLALGCAGWEETRVLRERSWGEIDTMPKSEFRRLYPQNAAYMDKDPLYWAPPAGTSIAAVAEDRVRNLLNTLHRENQEENVIAVTHGEFMWATRLTLEYWSDEDFLDHDANDYERIHNCTVLQYTRRNPETGELGPRLGWVRRAWPVLNEEGEWGMEETPWLHFERPRYSDGELLERAALQANRFDKDGL